ncbi:deoxyguanosinetriphosphate triphosphohydrolase [Hydrogenimonas sp.]|nr:deoxyguanosinetriphosphate triphosphohydrolase [Hydrogenimonas sp.]
MWDRLLSSKRVGAESAFRSSCESRDNFHKDYDRIIFSHAFRRLSKKTQVHPLSKNDHVHNRMTHSLEVASVGRSLGLGAGKVLKAKKIPVDPYQIAYIVQTACLAHDLGNPPFGHAGEDVIKVWFRENVERLPDMDETQRNDFRHFDGNAQSFRIVTQLENYLYNGGLRLTYATLATLVKYPFSSNECKKREKSKFGYFQSEKELFDRIFDALGLRNDDGSYRRHPLSYLMEAADDICYALLDIEDALELGIVRWEDVEEIFFKLTGESKVREILSSKGLPPSHLHSKIIAFAITHLVDEGMETFEREYDRIVSTGLESDLVACFDNRALREGLQEAKDFGVASIFSNRRNVELELGAYSIIKTILDALVDAACRHAQNEKLSFYQKKALMLMGEKSPLKLRPANTYEAIQRVVDYVSGMTDNHAHHVARQLKGVFSGVE